MSMFPTRTRGTQKVRLPGMRTGLISTDSVELSMDSLIRRFLLKAICEKIDIIEDLRENHFIKLVAQEKGSNEYRANCPFCKAPRTLTVNKKTGRSYCDACELTEDYFSLKGGYRMAKVQDVLVEVCVRIERQAKADSESPRKGGTL